MKNLNIILLVFLIAATNAFAKEKPIQIIYGEILQIDVSANLVSVGVLSRRNSTQVYQVLISQDTRRLGFDEIYNLKTGQKVEVDYFQNDQGALTATRFELMKPKEEPAESLESKKEKESEDFHF